MTGIDTNILVYACDEAEPAKRAKALKLLERIEDGAILWQVAAEFLAASRKLAIRGFTAEHAWNRLAEILLVFPLILPVPEVFERARKYHLALNVQFWDAMVLSAAVTSGMTRWYTEDIPGVRLPDPIEIVNPFM